VRAARVLVALVLCGVFLEFVSRTVHGWNAPLLPYYFDAGAPTLPRALNINASFRHRPPNSYITDDWSARVYDTSLTHSRMRDGVFVFGDSQMLGFMLEFRDTFASLLAARIAGGPGNARALASPAVHPGHFAAMLNAYAPHGLEPQKVVIAGLNLGNDLDEMYSEAFRWRRAQPGPVRRWLLLHSYIYMDLCLVRDHWLQPGNEPAGVNRILYRLDPDERIILVREAVRKIDAALRSPTLHSQKTLVVITPADYQIDAREFHKYRGSYRSDQDFERWEQQIPAFAAMMNALEDYAAAQLTSLGYPVVRFTKVVGPHAIASSLFDTFSHHLTVRGHRLLADAIEQELHR